MSLLRRFSFGKICKKKMFEFKMKLECKQREFLNFDRQLE